MSTNVDAGSQEVKYYETIYFIIWGKKIVIVSKQKNRQKYTRLLYTTSGAPNTCQPPLILRKIF